MDAAFPLLCALCFVGVCLLGVAGIVVLVLVLARQYGKKTDKNWQQVAENLGLTYGRDEVTNPFIVGRLDGVDVRVTTARSVRWTMGNHRKPMIWTHVTAAPAVKPRIEVWLRTNKVPQRDGLSECLTGDTAFDEQYKLLAPDGTDVNTVCPPVVRDVMLKIPRNVQIADESIIWSNGFVDHNQTRLIEALESCTQVAKAFDNHARVDSESD